MKIVITGLPQAGQQQFFSLLTGMPLDTVQQKPLEAQQGICEVKDPRITRLIEMYKPKKQAYARIEYFLLPDFNLSGPTKDLIFQQLKNAEEVCFVVREENAEAEISNFISELMINDLMLVEKRLANLAKGQKSKQSAEHIEKEKAFMELCKKTLEGEKPLKTLSFTDEQLKEVRTYQFFTMKPLILAVNVAENRIKESAIAKKVEDKFRSPCVQVCAELEEEISRLDEADRKGFMAEMGIDEPALDKMTRIAFSELGLISFFTVGEDEVKAWPIRRGSTAPEAGAAIHSDIEKGFVRAEQFTYDDFITAGSEAKVKDLGKFHLKGKDYIVQDGDILSFRFNV